MDWTRNGDSGRVVLIVDEEELSNLPEYARLMPTVEAQQRAELAGMNTRREAPRPVRCGRETTCCVHAEKLKNAPDMPDYTSATHGVVGLTKNAALHYADATAWLLCDQASFVAGSTTININGGYRCD